MAVASIDLQERDRRWLNIRRELERSGLSGLLVVSDGQLERRGAVRYVANARSGATLKWQYVLLPLKGNPVAIGVRDGWIEDRRTLPLRGGWVPESEPYAPVIADVIRELNIDIQSSPSRIFSL